MLANWGSPIGQPMLATHGVSCLSSMEFCHACHVRDRGYSCLLAMFPMVSCLSHGFVYHHGLACLPWVSQIHATLTLAHCPAPAGMPKNKDESPDQRDFKKEAKKFVKTLMEESDPKALLLQDVREAVQKELLKGEEPKHVAMFNAIVDSTVSHFHRKERGGQLFETERSFETNLQEMNG